MGPDRKFGFKYMCMACTVYIRHLMTRCQVKVVHLRQETQTSQKRKRERGRENISLLVHVSASMYFLALADYSNCLPFIPCHCLHASYCTRQMYHNLGPCHMILVDRASPVFKISAYHLILCKNSGAIK